MLVGIPPSPQCSNNRIIMRSAYLCIILHLLASLPSSKTSTEVRTFFLTLSDLSRMNSSGASRASDIFSSPPRGTELQKINHFYDTIMECINHLEHKMDENYSICKKALTDVRESVNERRSFAIRGEVHEKTYDVNVVSCSGELRWAWLDIRLNLFMKLIQYYKVHGWLRWVC